MSLRFNIFYLKDYFPKPSSILVNFKKIKEEGRLPEYFDELLLKEEFEYNFANEFQNFWIESGGFIREIINDDMKIIHVFRHIMPQYNGSDHILYRGENEERYNNGFIGLNWTTDISIAKQFAGGLNAYKSNGLLLKIECPSKSILASPNDHDTSKRESEFIVDCFQLKIEVIKTYPRNPSF